MNPGLREDRIFQTDGVSMRPLIRAGDRLGVEAAAPDTLRPGDLVAFERDGQRVVHRVLECDGAGASLRVREKGDNNRTSAWIPAAQCLGRAVWLERDGRRWNLRTSGRRVRWIVRLSRAEAGFFEFLRAARDRATGREPAGGTAAGRVVSALLWPARAVAGALLLPAYSREPLFDEDPELLRWLAAVPAALLGRNRLPAPPAGAPPRRLVEALATHGLEGLVHAAGDRAAALPPETRDDLARLRHRAAFGALAAKTSLAECAAALDAARVPFAVLKGPVLAERLHGDASLRASDDLDLLVARDHVDAALDALAGAGYRPPAPAWAQRAARRAHFHLLLTPARTRRVPVELHWDLVDRANLYRLDAAAVLARAQRVSAAGADVGVLEPGDEFIYLCLHLAKHGLFNRSGAVRDRRAAWFTRVITGNRMMWFMDLARHLERHGEAYAWDEMRARIRGWNVGFDVAAGLRILDRFMPSSRAAAALERLGLDRVLVPRPARTGAKDPESGPRHGLILRLMEADSRLAFRPARLLTVGRLLFPPPRELQGFYRLRHAAWLPAAYLWHPPAMIARLLGFRRGEGEGCSDARA